MIRVLIEKEFKQIFRNSFLPRLIVMFPCVMMLVFVWAATMEVKDVNISVVDNDHSSFSSRLSRKAVASPDFNLVNTCASYEEAMEDIEKGRADIILEIPQFFEKKVMNGEQVSVLISANTVNGMKGALGASYLSSIVTGFAAEIREEQGITARNGLMPQVEVVVQNRFNPHLDYKVFMIPALMVILLTMLCGFMPALNIVGEKEKGTIEQINVTPVSKFTFIMAKLIPYWIIGFVVLSFCFALVALVYGLTPAGNVFTIYLFTILYVLTVSGLGLIVSNYSETMQQAMLVMFFFMMLLILLSGLFTPISAMPGWAQWITVFNPLRYFIQVMRLVYLKGSVITDLYVQLAALVTFALSVNCWAVLSYRKSS